MCLIDLDPQAHSSIHLGVEAAGSPDTIYQVFSGARLFNQVRQLVKENLWLAPSDLDLAAAEMELVDAANREFVLKTALERADAEQQFDYIIIDCPPSLSVLTINALSAAGRSSFRCSPISSLSRGCRSCSKQPRS